jgi:hypothetical protein
MQAWVLRNANGSFRGKFHRNGSDDCPGRRMYEEKYPDQPDYVLVDIEDLPPYQEACQFECCFQGLPNTDAVAARYGLRGGAERAQRVAPGAGGGGGKAVWFINKFLAERDAAAAADGDTDTPDGDGDTGGDSDE